jgi:hypothetical protein
MAHVDEVLKFIQREVVFDPVAELFGGIACVSRVMFPAFIAVLPPVPVTFRLKLLDGHCQIKFAGGPLCG